ncbi:MAG: ribonuclease HII [Anaerolineales bacterium]|jgi:ribonuclease HII
MMSLRDPLKFPTLDFEQDLWNGGFSRIAGIDEAGRGAWAGPVYAAAVILPADPSLTRTLERVRDSKLMTPLARETWAPRIQASALAWGVGFASQQEIDALGIIPATKMAATRALLFLSSHPLPPDYLLSAPLSPDPLSLEYLIPSRLSPDYLLTDYLVFPNIELPQTALIKGDRLSLSVAAASVLAKTSRDARMRELDGKYPGYGFARHKGYGTRLHREAIQRLGLCEIHRKSFSISF